MRTFQYCNRAQTQNFNLLDIYHSTKKSIKILLGSLITISFCTTIYIFFSPKILEASAIITTTKPSNLEIINRFAPYKLSPSEVFLRIAIQLNSGKTRMDFFNENPSLFLALQRPDENLEQSVEMFFNNSFKLSPPEAQNSVRRDYFSITIQHPENIEGVNILNKFIHYAIQRERDIIEADINSLKNNKISKLNEKIIDIRTNLKSQNHLKFVKRLESNEIKRAKIADELSALHLQIKTEQNNRILKYNEAISIAQSIGLKTPSPLTPFINFSLPTMHSENKLNTAPLYLKGSRILTSELAATRLGDISYDNRIIEASEKLHLLDVNREVEILNNRPETTIASRELNNTKNKLSYLQEQNFDLNNLQLANIYIEPNETVLTESSLLATISKVTLGLNFGIFLFLIYIYPNTLFFKSTDSPLE